MHLALKCILSKTPHSPLELTTAHVSAGRRMWSQARQTAWMASACTRGAWLPALQSRQMCDCTTELSSSPRKLLVRLPCHHPLSPAEEHMHAACCMCALAW